MVPQEVSERAPRSARAQTGRRRRWTVGEPVFVTLEPADQGVDALFEVSASNRSGEPLVIAAAPGAIVEDDISGETELPHGGIIEVISWETPTGTTLVEGAVHTLAPGTSLLARVRVRRFRTEP
jgi:hypothetical protein